MIKTIWKAYWFTCCEEYFFAHKPTLQDIWDACECTDTSLSDWEITEWKLHP